MRPKSPRTSKIPSPGGITIAVMNPRSASRADSRSASSSGAELGERVAVGEESVLQRAQHAPFQFLTALQMDGSYRRLQITVPNLNPGARP